MCALCTRKYASTKTLLTHLKDIHLPTGIFHGGPKFWACGLCTTPLVQSTSSLLSHIAHDHSNEIQSCRSWDTSIMMHNLLLQPDVKAAYKAALDSEPIPESIPVWEKSILASTVTYSLQSGSFTNPQDIVEQALKYASRAVIEHRYCQTGQPQMDNGALSVGTSPTDQFWPPPVVQAVDQPLAELAPSPIYESGTGSLYANYGYMDYTQ
jgi:hypothetical protein